MLAGVKFTQKKTADDLVSFILNADFCKEAKIIPKSDFTLIFSTEKTGVHWPFKNIDYKGKGFKRLKILEKNQVLIDYFTIFQRRHVRLADCKNLTAF